MLVLSCRRGVLCWLLTWGWTGGGGFGLAFGCLAQHNLWPPDIYLHLRGLAVDHQAEHGPCSVGGCINWFGKISNHGITHWSLQQWDCPLLLLLRDGVSILIRTWVRCAATRGA